MLGSGLKTIIKYAMIVRTEDGLPMSANTDFSDIISEQIKMCKKYLKILSKKAATLPEKCALSLPSNHSTIYLITRSNASYMAVCGSVYPALYVFGFLYELQEDFALKYSVRSIQKAVRPYTFAEFDETINATLCRYNRPSRTKIRMNLEELKFELQMKPPYEIPSSDIVGNGVTIDVPYAISHKLQFEELNFVSFLTTAAVIMITLVSLFRSFSARESSEGIFNAADLRSILFYLDFLIRFYQIWLLFYQIKHRRILSWVILIVLLLLLWWGADFRDQWQNIVFAAVTILMHFCIITRQIQSKLPDYQV